MKSCHIQAGIYQIASCDKESVIITVYKLVGYTHRLIYVDCKLLRHGNKCKNLIMQELLTSVYTS